VKLKSATQEKLNSYAQPGSKKITIATNTSLAIQIISIASHSAVFISLINDYAAVMMLCELLYFVLYSAVQKMV
jgi:hypothetical protein